MESLFNLSSHLSSCSFKSHLEGISILMQYLSDASEIWAPKRNQQDSVSWEALCSMGYPCISERASELLVIQTTEKSPGIPKLPEMYIMILPIPGSNKTLLTTEQISWPMALPLGLESDYDSYYVLVFSHPYPPCATFHIKLGTERILKDLKASCGQE